jgi:hypothetical protein
MGAICNVGASLHISNALASQHIQQAFNEGKGSNPLVLKFEL